MVNQEMSFSYDLETRFVLSSTGICIHVMRIIRVKRVLLCPCPSVSVNKVQCVHLLLCLDIKSDRYFEYEMLDMIRRMGLFMCQ